MQHRKKRVGFIVEGKNDALAKSMTFHSLWNCFPRIRDCLPHHVQEASSIRHYLDAVIWPHSYSSGGCMESVAFHKHFTIIIVVDKF